MVLYYYIHLAIFRIIALLLWSLSFDLCSFWAFKLCTWYHLSGIHCTVYMPSRLPSPSTQTCIIKNHSLYTIVLNDHCKQLSYTTVLLSNYTILQYVIAELCILAMQQWVYRMYIGCSMRERVGYSYKITMIKDIRINVHIFLLPMNLVNITDYFTLHAS